MSETRLPLILLGPILRRVDQTQVCIWMACKAPVTVEAEIFRLSDLQNKAIRPLPIGRGTSKSLRLGKYLHIVLVIARPVELQAQGYLLADRASFPTDSLLAYDIGITDADHPDDKQRRLVDLGLTSGPDTIVYDRVAAGDPEKKSMLPTFFIGGKQKPFNFLHGSCRKLHGKGQDCLIAADELISSSFDDLNKRPSTLFLTGDQIYADDVAGPLSKYITELGVILLGWEERIMGTDRRVSEIGPGERQDVVKQLAKFTSGHAPNHLLAFGEFAAMYMLAWNAQNWPPSLLYRSTGSRRKRRKERDHIRQLEDSMRSTISATRYG